MTLNVLYYGESNISHGGGVNNVAYYLPQALSKKVNVTRLTTIKSNKDFPEVYINVFSQFIKKDFNIIHFNTNPTWINGSSILLRFARFRQACTVLNIHGIPQLERRAEQRYDAIPFNYWMNTLSYCNLADRIVVNSEFMRDSVVTWYGLDRKKVVVIPNGVDLKMYTENNNKIRLEGDPSIVYIGHLSRLKGIDILIQAIAELTNEFPGIKLHLIGNGNDQFYMRLAKEKGVENNVIFHGWLKHSLTPDYYKSSDICIFPSRHEGFGIVVLEAMASGIPVIASDIPSFREIISNGINGLLFKSEDANALAMQLTTLYKDSYLKGVLTQNALEKVTSYSWEKVAEKYISMYKNLCE